MERMKTSAKIFLDQKIPALNVSSSKAQDGSINISIVNVHPDKNISLEGEVRGIKATRVSGKILTAQN
jgi:alpha-N-arabinofuranosidase